jgi:hypothetical protein
MKRIIPLIFVCVLATGCIRPWQRDPETGQIPIVAALQEAAPSALSGNWLGAGLTLILGTVAGCLGMKRKKDDQISQIVEAIERFKKLGPQDGKSPIIAVLLSELSKSMNGDTKDLVRKIKDAMLQG